MGLERTLLCAVVLLLVAAPLRFGSVEPPATSILVTVCLLLGVVWVVWRGRRALPVLPWREPLLVAGAILLLPAVAQIVPLPRPLLETISPRAVELRDRYEPTEGEARFSGWRPVSLYPWATRQSALRLLAYVLVALIVVDLTVRLHARRVLVAALVGSGAFQAVYGLAEYLSGHQHIFSFAKKHSTSVATGTFINPNHFAGYLEMALPLALASAAGILADARVASEHPRERRVFAATLLLILGLVMAIALACSGSRMGIVSALMALLVVGSLLVWRGRRKGFAAAAALVALATAALLSRGPAGTSLFASFSTVGTELGRELGRGPIWSQVAEMAAVFPVLGVGLGAFPYVFPVFRTSGEGVSLAHAHNDYLEFAAETGAAGCFLALAALVLVVALVRRQLAAPSSGDPVAYGVAAGGFAVALHSLADFNMAIPSNALTLSVLIGMSFGWIQGRGPVLALDERRSVPWARRALLPAAALTGCALLAVSPAFAYVGRASTLDAGNAGRVSEEALEMGGRALRDLHTLVQARVDGGSPSALASSYLEGRLSEAAELQKQALHELPTSSIGHFTLGRFRVGQCAAAALASGKQDDCVTEALPELRLALDLSPMSAATHAMVARFLIAAWPVLDGRQRSEAELVIERAAQMNHGDRSLQERWAKIREEGDGLR